MRILNLLLKLFYLVCERNDNTKRPEASFSAAWGGGGGLWDTRAHRAGENNNTSEFDLINPSLPPVAQIRVTLTDLLHILPENRHKAWLKKKCLKQE
jgi:hypothetical protein